MSQVRRHDNVQLGPEDLLLSIVGGPGEEAVSIFKMVIASGWRPWRARLTPQTHGGFFLAFISESAENFRDAGPFTGTGKTRGW